MSCCFLEYCNVGKPYLRLRLPAVDAESEREVLLELEAHQLADGALKEPQEIAAMLTERLGKSKLPPVEVGLRSAQIYKTVLSLPVMNRISAARLCKKEQKEKEMRERSRKDERQCRRYTAVHKVWRHSLGTVFDTYYLPQETVRSLRTLVRLLGSHCRCMEPFGFLLQKTLPYTCAYGGIYIRGDSCTFLSTDEKRQVTTVDFAFSSQEELTRRLLLLMTRYELEHGALTHCHVDADRTVDLSVFGLSDLSREAP